MAKREPEIEAADAEPVPELPPTVGERLRAAREKVKLSLEDVAPTSHVVEVGNALREDVPVPCLPREVALAQAPAVQDGGFLVPSPQAGGPAA